MNTNISIAQIRQIFDAAAWWITWLAGLVLVVIFGASVAREIGYAIPYVPAVDATKLAYLAVIWWLIKR